MAIPPPRLPHVAQLSPFYQRCPFRFSPIIELSDSIKRKTNRYCFYRFNEFASLRVCHNIRIPRHKVFQSIAQRGKTSMGGYGFKLHLVVNHLGEILALKVTPGNVSDREPARELSKDLTGSLYGDKGYLSQELADDLAKMDLTFITKKRRNMKALVLDEWDKIMLKKRFIIETINGQLKTLSQIEHSRHRSITGFLLTVLSGLIAYCLKEKKPSLKIFYSEENISAMA
ncbi:IS982 family transposase [Xenorhabdus sp. BG5]|uniref:IS982 family transposase n=1 Tax=Xenorhabdus sp. BG5 TaxID=2782014 RepID=UPI001D147063|nr:IS982 family transposase [Xenorhabdus sp. BG5]